MINRILLILFSFFTLEAFDLTIITSVFKGDEFIEQFMEDIVKQTIYCKSQHIIINANSPGNEEEVIKKYLDQYKNIEYYKLEIDPGLYGVWNLAIRKAKADLIVNANLDDRFSIDAFEILSNELANHPNVDIVYSNQYITNLKNQKFESASIISAHNAGEFSKEKLKRGCFLGSHPMWRRSIHDRFGPFDEKFRSAGDWEMWLRASKNGAVFFHVNEFTGVNYMGDTQISTRKDLNKSRLRELSILKKRYNI
jgi:hypothetical protein